MRARDQGGRLPSASMPNLRAVLQDARAASAPRPAYTTGDIGDIQQHAHRKRLKGSTQNGRSGADRTLSTLIAFELLEPDGKPTDLFKEWAASNETLESFLERLVHKCRLYEPLIQKYNEKFSGRIDPQMSERLEELIAELHSIPIHTPPGPAAKLLAALLRLPDNTRSKESVTTDALPSANKERQDTGRHDPGMGPRVGLIGETYLNLSGYLRTAASFVEYRLLRHSNVEITVDEAIGAINVTVEVAKLINAAARIATPPIAHGTADD